MRQRESASLLPLSARLDSGGLLARILAAPARVCGRTDASWLCILLMLRAFDEIGVGLRQTLAALRSDGREVGTAVESRPLSVLVRLFALVFDESSVTASSISQTCHPRTMCARSLFDRQRQCVGLAKLVHHLLRRHVGPLPRRCPQAFAVAFPAPAANVLREIVHQAGFLERNLLRSTTHCHKGKIIDRGRCILNVLSRTNKHAGRW